MRGLVLEGGGTKGSYQIGAYKALNEMGMDFQGITGSSIGALNGAYIVQGDIKIMEEIWLEYDYKHFINVDFETYEKLKDIDTNMKQMNQIFSLIKKSFKENDGIDITPLREMLEKTLDEEKIRNRGIDFGMVTMYIDKKLNPQSLFLEDIEKGRLVDYLIASASLPIFKMNIMDNKLYVDGMFVDNLPIGMLEKKGYKDIVAIRIQDNLQGTMSIRKHNDLNLTVVYPSEYLGGSMNKDRDHIQKNINLGYLDTMKTFGKYDGVRFYFRNTENITEDLCFEKIRRISKKDIEFLCKVLNIRRNPDLRTLMEVIVPKIGEVLNLPKSFSYKDLYLSLYENILEKNNKNRIKVYDVNSVIKDAYNNLYFDYKNYKKNNIRLAIPQRNDYKKSAVVECLINNFK
ncbi:patatin-like phospholipase family protein [Peptacetobacter sp.]|uniref:patatin-like phospholipase family protein n=1 Tax=Peptacetobacter sp. TaxID=2991975 RepID=UPI00261AE067|nr:patatin-like phospholipase family protein [Peptacetobacter sp.]